LSGSWIADTLTPQGNPILGIGFTMEVAKRSADKKEKKHKKL
jgi:hypothetical protein